MEKKIEQKKTVRIYGHEYDLLENYKIDSSESFADAIRRIIRDCKEIKEVKHGTK